MDDSTLLQALWHYRRLPVPAVPPEEIASRFSVETTYSLTNFTPIGTHKTYRYLPMERLSTLTEHCPPVLDLVNATIGEHGARGGGSQLVDTRGLLTSESEQLSRMLRHHVKNTKPSNRHVGVPQ
jgi:hypothetical protein